MRNLLYVGMRCCVLPLHDAAPFDGRRIQFNGRQGNDRYRFLHKRGDNLIPLWNNQIRK
jgi:hypothetical protein